MRCGLLVPAVAAVFTALTADAVPSEVSLRNDPRFDTRVSRAVDGRPLVEVIPAIGKELGVALKTTPGTADERITLATGERPAGELLEALAQHLAFEWRRSGTGYELVENPEERRKREAARRAELASEWTEVRGWVGRVSRLAALPAAQLQAREQELSEQLKVGQLSPPERARAEEELAVVRDARRPATPLVGALLQSLTAAQVERLRNTGDLLLGEGDLPADLRKQVHAVRNPELPFQNPDEFPVWADVLIQFRGWTTQEGPPKPHERTASLHVTLVGWREQEGRPEWTAVSWQPALPERRAPPAETKTEDPALVREVELKVVPRRRAGLEQLGGAETAYTWESPLWPAWPTLGDAVRALHEATGLAVIADGFTRSRVDPQWLAGRRPVVRLLDRIASGTGYEWSKEGDRIYLRSRHRPRDRAREAPERIIRPWREGVARQGVTSLEDLAELASRLSDDQVLDVSDHWGWYFDEGWLSPPTGGAVTLYVHRQHLRFWAALSGAQRRAALAGETIPVEKLSAAQARAFGAALVEPVLASWGPGAEFRRKHPNVGLAEIQGGAFSLKQEDAWRQQLYVGTRADGTQTRILARRPSYRPANLGNLPPEFQWTAVGREFSIATYRFNYHLAGAEKPARTVELEISRPPSE